MTDMQALLETIDTLSHEEINQLYHYLEQRRRETWWVIQPENLEKFAEIMRPMQEDAAQMSEEEVNAVLDEALKEARQARPYQLDDLLAQVTPENLHGEMEVCS